MFYYKNNNLLVISIKAEKQKIIINTKFIQNSPKSSHYCFNYLGTIKYLKTVCIHDFLSNLDGS